MSETLLSIDGVHHAFGPTEVLHAVTLSLRPGEVVALLGPSGCGKTTLLHLAAGLLAPQRGRIAGAFARRVVMFQQPRLLPWQRTLDNIALGLRAAGLARAQARARATALGRAVGLDDAALSAFPHQLSGGMQSRAALARALVLEPDLLLLDEPFAALDIGLKVQLHRLLLQHRDRHGSAVLMITHDPAEAVRLADRVLVMAPRPGRVVHEHALHAVPQPRGETTVHQAVAGLLDVAAVRAVFGLGDGGAAAPLPPHCAEGAAACGTPSATRRGRCS